MRLMSLTRPRKFNTFGFGRNIGIDNIDPEKVFYNRKLITITNLAPVRQNPKALLVSRKK